MLNFFLKGDTSGQGQVKGQNALLLRDPHPSGRHVQLILAQTRQKYFQMYGEGTARV